MNYLEFQSREKDGIPVKNVIKNIQNQDYTGGKISRLNNLQLYSKFSFLLRKCINCTEDRIKHVVLMDKSNSILINFTC